MKKVNIFLDSSALIAGIISETGAAHVLLQLGETEDILLIISEMVVNPTKRSIARKSPDNLDDVQKEIKEFKSPDRARSFRRRSASKFILDG